MIGYSYDTALRLCVSSVLLIGLFPIKRDANIINKIKRNKILVKKTKNQNSGIRKVFK